MRIGPLLFPCSIILYFVRFQSPWTTTNKNVFVLGILGCGATSTRRHRKCVPCSFGPHGPIADIRAVCSPMLVLYCWQRMHIGSDTPDDCICCYGDIFYSL